MLGAIISHFIVSMQFPCRCDYLPLCSFVILQPFAADQEIMKSQTHCASQWMRSSFYQCRVGCFILQDCMLTGDVVVIHPQHAYNTMTLQSCLLKARLTDYELTLLTSINYTLREFQLQLANLNTTNPSVFSLALQTSYFSITTLQNWLQTSYTHTHSNVLSQITDL